MRDPLSDDRDGRLSRRGFVGRVVATGFTAAAAGSLLEAAGGGELQAADVAVKGYTRTGSRPQPVDVIAQVRLRGRTGLWNVGIQDGRISRISQAPLAGSQVVFGDGRLLTEGLVEHHSHMDKTLTADRVGWDEGDLAADQLKFEEAVAAGRWIRGRPFRIFRESLIKATFTEDDVFDRAVRAAKMMSANGTTAVRTHAVVEAVRGLNTVRGLLQARDAIRPYMDMQIVAFPQDDYLLGVPGTIDLIRRALQEGADAGATMGVGGLPELDWDHANEYIDLVFRLAKENGGFVDMHVDQPGRSRADERMFSHPIMVAKTREYGLQGQVTASHSQSLAFRPREQVLPVLDEMREVGVHLSCSANSYGEERVQIPRSRGVLVSLHNDNLRDPLQRGGRTSLVEAADIYRRQMRIISNEGLDEVFDLITTYPGQALGLTDYGLHEGGRADLVLFDAESAPEVVLHQARPALVFKNGRVVAQGGRALW